METCFLSLVLSFCAHLCITAKFTFPLIRFHLFILFKCCFAFAKFRVSEVHFVCRFSCRGWFLTSSFIVISSSHIFIGVCLSRLSVVYIFSKRRFWNIRKFFYFPSFAAAQSFVFTFFFRFCLLHVIIICWLFFSECIFRIQGFGYSF